MKILLFGAIAIGLAVPASGQESTNLSTEGALAVGSPDQGPATVLPANTEVLLRVNDTITTKGKHWKEGDTFNLSVVHDVRYGRFVIIPRGSRGVGRITWLTNKGAFGKSGKIDIELEYVEVRGRRIPVTGTYRQEGEGNTVSTVAGVVVVGVFAGFITGKSGEIPKGRELMAHTRDDLPLDIEGVQEEQNDAPLRISNPANSAKAADPNKAQERAKPESQPDRFGTSKVHCTTCR